MMLMVCGRWVLGAAVAGLALGIAGAGAAPMPLAAPDAPASVQNVQFFYYDNPPPPPPVYYDPPPATRYYYDRPRYFDDRPRYDRPSPRTYYAPRSPGYAVPTLSGRGRQGSAVIYDKDVAKDYMRNYRQTQKEIYKEKARAWNRANGY
jgi:hypothetical protein